MLPDRPTLAEDRRAGRLRLAARYTTDADSIEADLDLGRPNLVLKREGLDLVAQRNLANDLRAKAARLLVRAS